MDSVGSDFGHKVANGTIAYTIELAVSTTRPTIHYYPVDLEPPFTPFDPGQLIAKGIPPAAPQEHATQSWSVSRLFLPVMERFDQSRATAALNALSACQQQLCFEVIVTRNAGEFYLVAPKHLMGTVVDAWVSSYPAMAAVPTADPWERMPACVRFCDLCNPEPYYRSIQTNYVVSPIIMLLQMAKELREGEYFFYQVLLKPVVNDWQANVARLLDAERLLGYRSPFGRSSNPKDTTQPLFAVKARYGVTTKRLRKRLTVLAGVFQGNGRPFSSLDFGDYARVIGPQKAMSMIRERSSYTSGFLLTGQELSVMVHVPDRSVTGAVRVCFLQGLPVPARLVGSGVPLGVNTTAGVATVVCQPDDQQNKALWMPGTSRKGKTSAMRQQLLYRANRGEGVGFLDPHRGAAIDLLGHLHGIALERVVFLDFDDPEFIPCYNPFDCDDASDYGRLTTETTNSFKTLFDASGFYRMMHLLGNAIFALFVLKQNLTAIPTLFSKNARGEQLRREVVARATNPEVQRFWANEFHSYGRDAFAPIVNRLSALLLDQRAHLIFSQTANRIAIREIVNSGKILIVALPNDIDLAAIIGGLLISSCQKAALSRVGTRPRLFSLYVDESHRFGSSAKTIQSIIDETAKCGLNLILAQQETSQVAEEMLKPLLSMNIMSFGVNLMDAKRLAPLFAGKVSVDDLLSLGVGEVYARIDGEIVNFTCPPPPCDHDPVLAARIITHSREHYYTPAGQFADRPRQQRNIPTLE